MTFQELNIDQDMVDSLTARGILEPFPIQAEAIPLALAGNDLIGQAQTGTGKTLGFGLPLLQKLGTDPQPGVQALVVVPTRELANQVTEDLIAAAENRATVIAPIYGGKAYEGQIAQLKSGAQVVVGTPGRLLDLASQHVLSLAGVKTLVLDEADKMLDLGFLPDVERIFAMAKAPHQTMLFSATMPGAIVSLARRFMVRPIHVRVADPTTDDQTQANIEQFIYRTHALDKDEVISRILQAEGRERTIIFTRTKRAASKLADELSERGFKATAVHGDLNQEARERHLASFKAGKFDVLVATDVAARGLDVEDVTHVINHTIPEDEKDYLHRIGRTGRAGKTGTAVTFIDWDDLPRWKLIDKALGLGRPEPVETYSTSPNLFADLHIPTDVTGRLVPAPPREPRQKQGEHDRTSSTHGGKDRTDHKDRKTSQAQQSREGGNHRRGRRRQRTHGGAAGAQPQG